MVLFPAIKNYSCGYAKYAAENCIKFRLIDRRCGEHRSCRFFQPAALSFYKAADNRQRGFELFLAVFNLAPEQLQIAFRPAGAGPDLVRHISLGSLQNCADNR